VRISTGQGGDEAQVPTIAVSVTLPAGNMRILAGPFSTFRASPPAGGAGGRNGQREGNYL
jgi:hypothetical protein